MTVTDDNSIDGRGSYSEKFIFGAFMPPETPLNHIVVGVAWQAGAPPLATLDGKWQASVVDGRRIARNNEAHGITAS